MARKDWKISRKEKFIIVYKKLDKSDSISIYRGLLKGGWFLDLLNEPLSTRRFFKTKSQALKFAKAYMRKH